MATVVILSKLTATEYARLRRAAERNQMAYLDCRIEGVSQAFGRGLAPKEYAVLHTGADPHAVARAMMVCAGRTFEYAVAH